MNWFKEKAKFSWFKENPVQFVATHLVMFMFALYAGISISRDKSYWNIGFWCITMLLVGILLIRADSR